MDKIKTILFVILLIIIVGSVYLTTVTKENKPAQVSTIQNPTNQPPEASQATIQPDSKEVCYLKETKGEEGSDYQFISVNYLSDGKVQGVINWLPAEKDSLVGTFTGIEQGGDDTGPILQILYTSQGEGITAQQEETLAVGKDTISMATGEKFKDTDGIFKFKDPTKLSYETKIPLVDCNLVPERIKKDYTTKN